jgi:hypothetical protein
LLISSFEYDYYLETKKSLFQKKFIEANDEKYVEMQKYNDLVEEKLISSSSNNENLNNENQVFVIDDFDDYNNNDYEDGGEYEEMIVIGE